MLLETYIAGIVWTNIFLFQARALRSGLALRPARPGDIVQGEVELVGQRAAVVNGDELPPTFASHAALTSTQSLPEWHMLSRISWISLNASCSSRKQAPVLSPTFCTSLGLMICQNPSNSQVRCSLLWQEETCYKRAQLTDSGSTSAAFC